MINDPVEEAEAIVNAQLQEVVALHTVQDAQLLLLTAAARQDEAQAWMLSRAAESGMRYAALVAAATVSVARTHFARFTRDPDLDLLAHYIEHDNETTYPHDVAHTVVRGMLGDKPTMMAALDALLKFIATAPDEDVSWVLVHVVHIAAELMHEMFEAARKAVTEED